MIPRYTREAMGKIWSEGNKFIMWLKVELAIIEAKEERQQAPFGMADRIEANVVIDGDRIEELEAATKHDMMAFVQMISEQLQQKSLLVETQHFHAGVTSYDIEDTALAVLMNQSLEIVDKGLKELSELLGNLAVKYKKTPQIGRTHGMHAEPITFGFKLLNWYDEIERHRDRINQDMRDRVAVGKISGAVGTFANIDPEIEVLACNNLNINNAYVSTQIVSRDRHAEYVFTMALIAGSLAKFATEIRNLHRTEIAEVSEPFKKGQKGSSAMPHKKNPVSSENVSSLARLLRGYVVTALENQETWHERDLANSANERIILADSSILADYMIARFTNLLRGLVIRPESMEKNLDMTGGLVFSEQVMLALARKGMVREEAHDLIQEIALLSMEKGIPFRDLLRSSVGVTSRLSEEELFKCFDPLDQLKNVDEIFDRFAL